MQRDRAERRPLSGFHAERGMTGLCHHCRKPHHQPPNQVNRAMREGLRLFCGRRCAGLARRKHKTKAQKVAEKRLYDAAYRVKNRDRLKLEKQAYFQRTYDPVKAAKERKKRMHLHVAYCRQPAYKLKKRAYDMKRRDSEYGPFADAARLAIELTREILTRSTRYEIRRQNQTGNKTQNRRRAGQEAERDRHSRAQG